MTSVFQMVIELVNIKWTVYSHWRLLSSCLCLQLQIMFSYKALYFIPLKHSGFYILGCW